MKYGFIKVAAAVPAVKVADVEYNVQEMEKLIAMAEDEGVEIMCFPELSITGYSCQDLFKEQLLLSKAEEGLMMLMSFTRKLNVICVVGMPVQAGGLLLNCAVVIQSGTLLGIVPKTYLPNYNEFYEKRWFASAQDLNPTDLYLAGSPIKLSSEPKLFKTGDGVKFGVEICEDVWAPIPPSNQLTMAGADIILNLSASDELIGKHAYLRSLVAQQSARTISGYVYASCGFGESTQDVVYGGNAMIFENGKLIKVGSTTLKDKSGNDLSEEGAGDPVYPMKHGDTITITDFPDGFTLTVSEPDTLGYILSYKGMDNTTSSSGQKTVLEDSTVLGIVNTYTAEYAVTITELTQPREGDPDYTSKEKAFSILLTLTKDDDTVAEAGIYGEVEFATVDGATTATLSLANGQSKALSIPTSPPVTGPIFWTLRIC